MAWYRRLLNAFRADHVARDIEREMDFHLAERANDLEAAGLSARDAALEARRRFGNRTLLRERTHETDVFAWIASVNADIRYAARALRSTPGFTSVAILSLALGIGANTAIFNLTDALLLKPLPVSHPEQLLQVHMDTASTHFTNPLWEQIRDNTAAFARPLAYSATSFNLSRSGEERRVTGAWVSGDFFATVGVSPAAGRLFIAADDMRGCNGTAVVSQGFADRELGGTNAAVGKVLSLHGKPFQVLGVVDGSFFGIEVGQSADIYAPLCAQALTFGPTVLDHRSRWFLEILLRPKPGVSADQVNARLAVIAPRVFAATIPGNWTSADQREYAGQTLAAAPASTGLSDLRQTYSLALYTLMAVVALVLVVASANIANLLLARVAARQRELAIRIAMGAGRWRLVRQLLTESVSLAGAGAILGVLFAQWASRLLVGMLSMSDQPVFLDLSLDRRVLGFTLLVAVLTVAIFGIAPGWRTTRVDAQSILKSGGRTIAGGAHTLGSSLVVAQIALSLALIAASGLLLGSFRRLVTLDPGFRREGVTIASFDLKNAHYEPEQLVAVKRDILARVRAVPAVTSASISFTTPIGSAGWNEIIGVDGFSPADLRDSLAMMNQVSDGYFATLGTPLVAGRDILPSDMSGGRRVALINETMARHFFRDASPIGRTFRIEEPKQSTTFQIIGIVGDAKYQRLTEKPQPTAYLPLGQGSVQGAQFYVELRSTGPEAALSSAIRDIAAAVNPSTSLKITTLSAQVSASLARPRLLATLSSFFGALAPLLAVIGLYGTMSYNVNRRRNEIGVRMALGAANGQLMRMIAREAARLIFVGIAFGLALALMSTRFIRTLLFGVTPSDPGTFVMAAFALGSVALAAALVPAARAARQDPMTALRVE
jgi:predicted permease